MERERQKMCFVIINEQHHGLLQNYGDNLLLHSHQTDTSSYFFPLAFTTLQFLLSSPPYSLCPSHTKGGKKEVGKSCHHHIRRVSLLCRGERERESKFAPKSLKEGGFLCRRRRGGEKASWLGGLTNFHSLSLSPIFFWQCFVPTRWRQGGDGDLEEKTTTTVPRLFGKYR